MNPQVSIIVPVYNVERYLARCLDSLVGQTLREIEILCVDDESPDRSTDILRDYAARDSRIRIISQKNKGLGGARNTGTDAAQGEYVAFIDSDDWLDADYFEKALDAARRHDADIACMSVSKERPRRRRWQLRYTREEVTDDPARKFALCNCPPVFNATNKLYRRELLGRLGLRFGEHVCYEDVEHTMRVLYASRRLVTVPGPCYHYIVHGQSITKSAQSPKKQRDKYLAHKAFIAFADAHGIRIGRRFRNVTLRTYAWCGISWLKVKDDGKRRTYRILDLLPVWHKKNE